MELFGRRLARRGRPAHVELGRAPKACAELSISFVGISSPRHAHFFLPAVAFLITVAALRVSASVSKPKMPEYLLPTACATTKLMLIPASAIALAMACAMPGLLSPSTSRHGISA